MSKVEGFKAAVFVLLLFVEKEPLPRYLTSPFISVNCITATSQHFPANVPNALLLQEELFGIRTALPPLSAPRVLCHLKEGDCSSFLQHYTV